MAKKFELPSYLTSIDDTLTRKGSPLNDFPFTDSLTFDQQFEVDSSPVYTAGLFRTSRGPNRVQLASFNELGAQAGGVYIFDDGLIATAYTQGTIFFYDNSGAVSSTIQQPTPGNLGISSESVDIIGTTDIVLTAPDITLDGDVHITGIIGGDSIIASSWIAVEDGITAPSTIPGYAQIYVDVADGDLKVKFGDGTVKTIVTDT